jgi:hypothetical protein
MLMLLRWRNWICPRYAPFFYFYFYFYFYLPLPSFCHPYSSLDPHGLPLRLAHTSCSFTDFQHCDFYWAAEAVEWAYTSMLDDIESTRSKYPGEEGEERDEMQTETEFRMDVQHEG